MSLVPSPPPAPATRPACVLCAPRRDRAATVCIYIYILSFAAIRRHCAARPHVRLRLRRPARPPSPPPPPPTLLFAADGNRIFPPQNKPGRLPVCTHTHTHTPTRTDRLCIVYSIYMRAASRSRGVHVSTLPAREHVQTDPFFFSDVAV